MPHKTDKKENARLKDRLVKGRKLLLKISKENHRLVDWINRAKIVITKLQNDNKSLADNILEHLDTIADLRKKIDSLEPQEESTDG